jgi:signal transduction histidine kinase
MTKRDAPYHAVVEVCLVAAVSYLSARLGGALILRPQMVSPLWLGNVVLVAALLLARRKNWPVLLATGLAAFLLFDLQSSAPMRSIVWLLLSNAVEVLIAALCLGYLFDGPPRLDSIRSLAKYSFYGVFLAPFVGAFFGALSTTNNYWPSWKVAFFSEALGFLTLMPAILGWARRIPNLAQKPRAYYLEAAALLAALFYFGTLVLAEPARSTIPGLLYSLLPLLLWSALRFGSTGVSTSMTAIAFVSIWGAVHGRGPFVESGSQIDVLSLQLFLFFTAAPFLVLAALVEENKCVEQSLRQRDRDFNEAQRLAQLGSWQWDPVSDAVTWSAELYRLAGFNPHLTAPSFQAHKNLFAPESWSRLQHSVAKTLRTGVPYELDVEGIRPDGSRLWLTSRGEAVVDAKGSPISLRGTTQNITDRKLAEDALLVLSGRLLTAQDEERTRIAGELHDDLSQRMALLQIGLEQFAQEMPGLSSHARIQLQQIAAVASEISSDIHNLSHQLHPSKLDTLGLQAALGGFCKEFSLKHQLKIEFIHQDVPAQIPRDVTLCLFRIAQEALRNVMKHSGATEARVALSGHADRIELCISDSGVGFDPAELTEGAGIGLISMRERLRLVGGDLSLESMLAQGTRIHVRIPLSGTATQRAIEPRLAESSA